MDSSSGFNREAMLFSQYLYAKALYEQYGATSTISFQEWQTIIKDEKKETDD